MVELTRPKRSREEDGECRDGRLSRQIKQRRPFASPAEEAFLNLLRTTSLLSSELSRRLKPYELSPAQYNLLRILRGAHPRRLTCGDISERLVSPGQDVTRLLDRLERRALIVRSRDPSDRRLVCTGISSTGLAQLSELDRPVDEWLRELLGHLDGERLELLVELLEEARDQLDE